MKDLQEIHEKQHIIKKQCMDFKFACHQNKISDQIFYKLWNYLHICLLKFAQNHVAKLYFKKQVS